MRQDDPIEVPDDATLAKNEYLPSVGVDDEDVYILNPLFRLRNAKDHVLAHGAFGMGTFHCHKAIGITVALCNGKRTVADIARITRPFVKISDDEEALKVANRKVKAIVHGMSLTKEEREGKAPKPSDFPSAAVLMRKADYDNKFGETKIPVVEYDARAFLPKETSEIGNGPFRVCHESAPLELNWHFTSKCSTDCRYCYLGRRNVEPMAKERVLSLIQEAAAIGVLSITPAGGDILLYPHLRDVFEEMSKHRFIPAVISTKSYFGKDKAKEIADASVVWEVQFSLDSTVDEVADYLVGTTGFCKRMFTSIDNALEAGLRVSAKAVITPYNILTIPKLYRDLKKRGVSTIHLASYARSGYHHSDDFFNHQDSFEWLRKQLEQLRQEFPGDNIYVQNGPPSLQPSSREARQSVWKQRSTCTAGRSVMMIWADGKVIPCEQLPETEEFFCGDVSCQSIQEVWDGERLRELTYGIPREKFRSQPCYDCEEREECHGLMGYCIRDLVLHFGGNIYQPPSNCPKSDMPFVRTV